MIGSSPFETEVRQGLDDIEGAEAAGDPDRQAIRQCQEFRVRAAG
jgi:hypothetical protein